MEYCGFSPPWQVPEPGLLFGSAGSVPFSISVRLVTPSPSESSPSTAASAAGSAAEKSGSDSGRAIPGARFISMAAPNALRCGGAI